MAQTEWYAIIIFGKTTFHIIILPNNVDFLAFILRCLPMKMVLLETWNIGTYHSGHKSTRNICSGWETNFWMTFFNNLVYNDFTNITILLFFSSFLSFKEEELRHYFPLERYVVVVFVLAVFLILYSMLFKNSGIALICRVLHGLFKLASELFGINIQVSSSCLHEGAQAHWSLYRK